jgi:hypothetical protein
MLLFQLPLVLHLHSHTLLPLASLARHAPTPLEVNLFADTKAAGTKPTVKSTTTSIWFRLFFDISQGQTVPFPQKVAETNTRPRLRY